MTADNSPRENGSPEKLLGEKTSADDDGGKTLQDTQTRGKMSRLIYTVDANPPWSITILYAIQVGFNFIVLISY